MPLTKSLISVPDLPSVSDPGTVLVWYSHLFLAAMHQRLPHIDYKSAKYKLSMSITTIAFLTQIANYYVKI